MALDPWCGRAAGVIQGPTGCSEQCGPCTCQATLRRAVSLVGGAGVQSAQACVTQLWLVCARALPLIAYAPLLRCLETTRADRASAPVVKAPLKRRLSDGGCHRPMSYLGPKPSVYSLC